MSLEENVDGTQSEEVHLLYMERVEAFAIHFLDYHLIFFCLDLASSCYLAGLQCCLAQGCSQAGIPPLPLRGLLGEYCIDLFLIQD